MSFEIIGIVGIIGAKLDDPRGSRPARRAGSLFAPTITKRADR
jgi:hypothetical protein